MRLTVSEKSQEAPRCPAQGRVVGVVGQLKAAGVFGAADSGKGAKGQKYTAPDSALKAAVP